MCVTDVHDSLSVPVQGRVPYELERLRRSRMIVILSYLKSCSSAQSGTASVRHRDLIACPHHALGQNGGIDAGLAFMIAHDAPHHFRIRLRCVGIEGNHLAAGIALKHNDLGLLAEPQSLANELVL